MAADLRALVLGTVLSLRSRVQLADWMVAEYGPAARSSAPASRRAGAWATRPARVIEGTVNDVAVLWRPGGTPLVATVYITGTKASFDASNAAIAAVRSGGSGGAGQLMKPPASHDTGQQGFSPESVVPWHQRPSPRRGRGFSRALQHRELQNPGGACYGLTIGGPAMIRLSNGHVLDHVVASGSLAFDGKGWPWERPMVAAGLIRPELFTVVLKTLTRDPRRGNLRWHSPWSCVALVPGGAVNKVGLTNPGVDWWVRDVGPKLDTETQGHRGLAFSVTMPNLSPWPRR